VTVFCQITKDCPKACNEKKFEDDAKSYYEAWEWKPGSPMPAKEEELGRGDRYTDRASFAPPKKSCGYFKQVTEVRFYCGSLRKKPRGIFSKTVSSYIKHNWKNPTSFKTPCGIITVGTLHQSVIKPWFWDGNGVSDVDLPRASRTFEIDWECCRKNTVSRPTSKTEGLDQ
jgi:hypothetical protein